jgi:small subunit ribosomal protein S16
MVKVRLFRMGASNRPFYRVVAIDSRRARNGRVLEFLGTYNPRAGGGSELNLDRIQSWIERGAQPSDTVRSLLRSKRADERKAQSEAAPAAS